MRWMLAILLRRHLPGVAVLSTLVAAAGATVLPSYARTYQTDAARAAAVEMAARNGASLVSHRPSWSTPRASSHSAQPSRSALPPPRGCSCTRAPMG